MRETVLLFTNIREAVKMLTDEQAGQVFKAILDYQTDNEVELDGLLNVVFSPIKQQIDYNNAKWDAERKKRSEAGKKGMKNRWNKDNNTDNNVITKDNSVITKDNSVTSVITDYNKLYQAITPITVNVNDNVNDNVNKKQKKKREKKSQEPKEPKDSYGELGNVKLTKAEYERLVKDYGEDATKKAIEYLDGYIVDKRYKSDDNNRALRRWVFDAVREQEQKRARIKSYDKPGAGNSKNKFNNFPQNTYDYEALERELLDN